MMRVFYLAILFGVLTFSCTKKSVKVTTNDIYQNYRIEYNEGVNETRIKCRIRNKKKTGAKIKFVDNDFISILGVQAEYDGTGTYNYEAAYYTFYDSVYISIFHKGQTINNYFKFDEAPYVGIPAGQQTYYTGWNWTFYWDGPPLSNGEEIKFEVLDYNDNVLLTERSDDDEYYFMEVNTNELGDDFQPGVYKLRVSREKTIPLKLSTGAGGDCQMVYIDEGYITIY